MPAPVILFVYKRPDHTRKAIASLQQCHLAEETPLYVFSDGAKKQEDEAAMQEVRTFLDTVGGFAKVEVIRRKANVGLAFNIIEGVSQVMEQYGRAIVIEDDLIFSLHFLQYMNGALDHYQHQPEIFAITGYNPAMKFPSYYHKKVYLNYRSSSWGWATWANRWASIDWEVKDFASFVSDKQQQKLFNRPGEDMSDMLIRQMQGEINSWSIRFSYAQFKHQAYAIYPVRSLVANIGTDGSGTHSGTTNRYAVNLAPDEDISFPEHLQVDENIIRTFRKFYRFSLKKKVRKMLMSVVKNNIAYEKKCKF